MRTWTTVAAVLAVVGALAYVASLNTAPIGEIDLFVKAFSDVPTWLALLGSFVIGASLVALVFTWPILRLKLNVRRARRRIDQLEQELHGLRTLPLGEETAEARHAQES